MVQQSRAVAEPWCSRAMVQQRHGAAEPCRSRARPSTTVLQSPQQHCVSLGLTTNPKTLADPKTTSVNPKTLNPHLPPELQAPTPYTPNAVWLLGPRTCTRERLHVARARERQKVRASLR